MSTPTLPKLEENGLTIAGPEAPGREVQDVKGEPASPTVRAIALLLITGVGLSAAVLASGFQYAANVKAWDVKLTRYQALAGWFRDHAPPDSRPLVVDPPAYAYAGGGSSLVTPDDGVEAAVALARRYGARYLTLEPAHPRAFHDFYEGRASDPRLVPVGELDRCKIWAIRIEQ